MRNAISSSSSRVRVRNSRFVSTEMETMCVVCCVDLRGECCVVTQTPTLEYLVVSTSRKRTIHKHHHCRRRRRQQQKMKKINLKTEQTKPTNLWRGTRTKRKNRDFSYFLFLFRFILWRDDHVRVRCILFVFVFVVLIFIRMSNVSEQWHTVTATECECIVGCWRYTIAIDCIDNLCDPRREQMKSVCLSSFSFRRNISIGVLVRISDDKIIDKKSMSNYFPIQFQLFLSAIEHIRDNWLDKRIDVSIESQFEVNEKLN